MDNLRYELAQNTGFVSVMYVNNEISVDVWDAQGDFTINKDCITYGSIHDGDAVELHLCCKCFDALVASCVIDPVIEREETSLG